MTAGADRSAPTTRPPNSSRKWCTACGGHLFTDHPGMKLVDIYAANLPGLAFKPAIHVNYVETVLPMKDGLPKFRDFPKEVGGIRGNGSGIAKRLGTAGGRLCRVPLRCRRFQTGPPTGPPLPAASARAARRPPRRRPARTAGRCRRGSRRDGCRRRRARRRLRRTGWAGAAVVRRHRGPARGSAPSTASPPCVWNSAPVTLAARYGGRSRCAGSKRRPWRSVRGAAQSAAASSSVACRVGCGQPISAARPATSAALRIAPACSASR